MKALNTWYNILNMQSYFHQLYITYTHYSAIECFDKKAVMVNIKFGTRECGDEFIHLN